MYFTTIIKQTKLLLRLSACIAMVGLSAGTAQASGSSAGPQNVNVDLFRGRLNVNIPIYNYKSRYLSVPITMSYSPVDIKAMGHVYHNSWVGLGWNLSAGGSITRTVKGIPDERNSTIATDLVGNFYLDDETYNPNDKTPVPPTKYDIDEDEFSFNFNGYSGSFIYYRGKWKLNCNSQFQIIPTVNRVNIVNGSEIMELQSIKLKAVDGNVYYFGKIEENLEAIEYDYPLNGSSHKTPIRWHLVRIESPEGDQINFEYALEYSSLAYTPIQKQSVIQQDKLVDKNEFGVTKTYRYSLGIIYESPTGLQISQGSVGSMTYRKYLKSISSTTSSIKINFSKQSISEMEYPEYMGYQGYKLDKVSISNEDINFKEFVFSFTGGTTTELLQLTSLQEWGISATGTASSLPAYQFIYSLEEESNPFSYAMEKITYPTGGYTSFEYGLHDYDGSINNCTNRPEGFRINSKTSKGSDSDESLFTEYYYVTQNPIVNSEYGTSGQMSRNKVVEQKYWMDPMLTMPEGDELKIKYEVTKTTQYDCEYPETMSDMNNYPNTQFPANQIGYSSVWEVESKLDALDNKTIVGYTQYTFENYIPDTREPIKRNNFNMVGKMKGIHMFNNLNSELSSTEYQYSNISPLPATSFPIRYFYISKMFSDRGALLFPGTYKSYSANFSHFVLSKEINTTRQLASETTYKYDPAINKVSEVEVVEMNVDDATAGTANEKLSRTTTTFRYMKDFDIQLAGIDIEWPQDPFVKQKTLLVEKVVKKDDKVISAEFTKYNEPTVANSNCYVRPIETYVLDITSSVTNYVPVDFVWTTRDSRYKLKATYKYDEYGRLIESQKEGSAPVSLVYDPTNILNNAPLLQIVGISNQYFQENVGSLSVNNAADINAMRAKFAPAQITSYTYDSRFGVTSVTSPNGITITNEYDVFGRLSTVKDKDLNILKSVEYNNNIQ